MIRLNARTFGSYMESGDYAHSRVHTIEKQGHNQRTYVVVGESGEPSVVKELEPEFHGDSPHRHWGAGRRADASVDAYTAFPDLFPRTVKTGEATVSQDYVHGGLTYGDALERGDAGKVRQIFSGLRRVHDAGYIHGDVTGRNLQAGQVLSVDTETFGRGDRTYDLRKARRTAHEKGRAGIVDSVIEDLYGPDVLQDLRRAA